MLLKQAEELKEFRRKDELILKQNNNVDVTMRNKRDQLASAVIELGQKDFDDVYSDSNASVNKAEQMLISLDNDIQHRMESTVKNPGVVNDWLDEDFKLGE